MQAKQTAIDSQARMMRGMDILESNRIAENADPIYAEVIEGTPASNLTVLHVKDSHASV